MDDEITPVDNWEGYESARLRNNEIHGEYLRTYAQRAYEYGVLAVKNFMLISGGALVVLPALAKMVPDFDQSVAVMAGACFAGSLLTSLVCTYVIHLNWLLLYDSQELASERDMASISMAFLPSRHDFPTSPDLFARRIDRKHRKVWLSWIIPHILGVVGFAIFLLGCWFFYSGFDLAGAAP